MATTTAPTITQDMTPQQRAAVYVQRLSAVPVAQRTATQSAELAKYQGVAGYRTLAEGGSLLHDPLAIGGNPIAGTSGGAATPAIGGNPIAGTSGGAATPAPGAPGAPYLGGSQGYQGGGPPGGGAFPGSGGQPNIVEYTRQVVAQYGSNSPQALALAAQQVSASVAQGVALATNNGNASQLSTYRSQWQTLPTEVQSLGASSVSPAQAVAIGSTWTPAEQTAIAAAVLSPSQIGATQVPAGGNASSLIPAATTTSSITGQGSGTSTSTAVMDTGAGGATSGAASTTGAGGYDTGTTTGTATSGGITTSDLILIGIAAAGLLLTMKGKKHHAA